MRGATQAQQAMTLPNNSLQLQQNKKGLQFKHKTSLRIKIFHIQFVC
jgi:hypothetical protein